MLFPMKTSRYDVKNMSTKIVNRHDEPYDIYIGRGTVWGNPFVVGKHGTRDEVIEMYREWLAGQWDLIERLDELRGKVLGCSCKPKACHGDILVELVDRRT